MPDMSLQTFGSWYALCHETVRQWARKFGQQFASQIRRRLPRAGDKWHLDEVVLKICGVKHWLWRAVLTDRQAPTRHRGMRKARLAVYHRSACSGVKALRNTSPLGGKPPSFATVSVP